MFSHQVHDVTDHVWVEVWSDERQRWIHLDSCENAFDAPKLYESGWGKKLSYIHGFARDHMANVAPRYVGQKNQNNQILVSYYFRIKFAQNIIFVLNFDKIVENFILIFLN